MWIFRLDSVVSFLKNIDLEILLYIGQYIFS